MKTKISMLFAALVVTGLSGHVLAHGNVIPQGADSSAMPPITDGDESENGWVFENPYRSLDEETKTKVIKFGESAYANNCAGCHGLHAQSGGINQTFVNSTQKALKTTNGSLSACVLARRKACLHLAAFLKVKPILS